jgi:hypothetical protein
MDDKTRFTLRIDKKLHEKLKKQADNNKRSVTKEIEYILEKHLNGSESHK